MKQYAWSRHSDDELWYGGPCDSIRECVEEAQGEDYKMDDTIALGLIERYEVNYDFAQDIVERLCEDAWDEDCRQGGTSPHAQICPAHFGLWEHCNFLNPSAIGKRLYGG